MTKAGDRILRSLRQAVVFARGELTEGFVIHVPKPDHTQAMSKKRKAATKARRSRSAPKQGQ